MDTKLEGQYPQKSAFATATIAMQCLNYEAKLRPRMVDVLAALEPLQAAKNGTMQNRVSFSPMHMSPLKQHSPLNLTPLASPLPAQRRSPRVR